MLSLLGDVAENTGTPSQPASIMPSARAGGLLSGAFFYPGLAISLTLLLGGVLGKSLWTTAPEAIDTGLSVLLGVGALGVAAAVILTIHKLLFEDWKGNNALRLARAFIGRDNRGGRLPRYLSEHLASLDNLEDALSNQTEESLLALLALSESQQQVRNAILKLLGTDTIADALLAHPECSTLTKIDFALGDDIYARRAAEKLLPRFLRQREIRALLESTHPEARIAALRRMTYSRALLVKSCRLDRSPDVREVAWQQIKEPTWAEAADLLRSRHLDTRSRVVRAGLLPHNRLIEVCSEDAAESIRREAWQQIQRLRPGEASFLLTSPHADVRVRAVESGLLDQTALLETCRDDIAMSVRHSARERLQPLTQKEALLLLRSEYTDTRCFAVESGLLPDKTLLKLCHKDKAQAVRKEALRQIERRASIPIWQRDTRRAVEKHLAASRKRLNKLLLYKWTERRLLPAIELMAVEELNPLLSHYSDDVKRIAIRHLGERRDKQAVEMLKPFLANASLQQEAVEAFLKITGNSDMPTIIRDLGLTTTFQVTAEDRLIAYLGSHFRASEPEEIADTLFGIDRKSKRISVGTQEVEDTEYDSYGGSYTSTRTDTHHIEVSYFPPDAISKIISLLKLLDERKRLSVARLLTANHPELGSLIQLGIDNQDWKTDLYEPVLRAAREVAVGRFTRYPDERIIKQLA